jgi:tetratricopeptide (TPR) repeat protein
VFCKRTAILVCCFLVSCSRASAPRESIEQLAILPFENLTSNTDLDWISRLSAAVLAYDLTGPRRIHPIRVESIADARLNHAGRTVEGYFASEHGELAFHATIANRTFVVSGSADDVIAAMNRLAKDLSSDARGLAGCNAATQRLYGEALRGRGEFDSVAQAASGCAPVYLHWSETLLARGDREGAVRACTAALALRNTDAIDRTQFEYLCALARGDSAARLAALQKLAALLPSDPELLRNVAELQLANRKLQAAADTFVAATRADPDDATAWNELGYARAGIHDLRGAIQALKQYQKLLPPENPNALDSLGEVSFFLGEFTAAEQYFLEARELLKAAQAHMMTGDLAGADRIFARQPNWSELDRAQWEFITGRRKKAIARLLPLSGNPDAARQLALWNAQTGQGPEPLGGNDPLSRAVAPLLSGQFREALPLLEPLYLATTPGADGQVRTLLAWAYARSGQREAAIKLLDLYPIPLASSGDAMMASLVFPRFVQLRGELLHSEKDQQLARVYAGDLPDKVP